MAHARQGRLIRENDVRLYQRFAPLPRASVVYASEAISGAERLDHLLDLSFDVRNVAEPEMPWHCEPPLPLPPKSWYGNSRVVSETWRGRTGYWCWRPVFSGWEATVDGIATPVLRANHFHAVPLSAGRHASSYLCARSLRIGGSLAVSGVVLAILLLHGLAAAEKAALSLSLPAAPSAPAARYRPVDLNYFFDGRTSGMFQPTRWCCAPRIPRLCRSCLSVTLHLLWLRAAHHTPSTVAAENVCSMAPCVPPAHMRPCHAAGHSTRLPGR
jgi:hypothetical protein